MELIKKEVSNKINFFGLSLYAALMPIMQNPYDPLFDNNFFIGKIQFVDIIFLLILPFIILDFFREKENIFKKYILQIFAIAFYLLSIIVSIKNLFSPEALFQLISAIYLSVLFLSLSVVIKTKKQFIFVWKCIVLGCILNLVFSIFGLIIFYFFNYSWPYVIQENKVFPYLGEVVRLTGSFKPTAKLLSTYLTLLIPCFISISILQKGFYRNFFLLISFLSLIIYPFTLSRGIVGLSFSITFLFSYFKNNNFLNRIYFKLSSFIFICLFIITLTLSTIHISNFSTNYSYDIELNEPSTVYYYYDPRKGKEKITTEIEFGGDHYFWLKKASFILFKKNLFGVGVGNFSDGLKSLEIENLIPKNLSRHPTPQSEFLLAASERGIFGIISIIFLFFSWLRPLFIKKKNLILYAGMGSIISLCFIDSINLEITKFRFLWFFVGFLILYTKSFVEDEDSELSN